MASLVSNMYRPCYAKGERGLFHCWADVAEVVAPSMLRGGHNGGQLRMTYGIVELQDGRVKLYEPKDIRFADGGAFAEFLFFTEEQLDEIGKIVKENNNDQTSNS